MRKSLSVAAVFFVLAWTQANAWADEILVSAAASLTDVLKEISTSHQSKSKHTVKFNFGPSNGLARQIEEGAPARRHGYNSRHGPRERIHWGTGTILETARPQNAACRLLECGSELPPDRPERSSWSTSHDVAGRRGLELSR